MNADFDVPLREDCVYTKCYCEENIWKLCEHVKNATPGLLDNVFVIFISNDDRTVPLWHQRARKEPDVPVVWDYHVILIIRTGGNNSSLAQYDVYDLDTYLPFPTSLATYVKETIKPSFLLKPKYDRMLKVIDAEEYLLRFASDRSHMKNDDGSWMAEPPLYPCITTSSSHMNLEDYINMKSGVGTVYTVDAFMDHFELK